MTLTNDNQQTLIAAVHRWLPRKDTQVHGIQIAISQLIKSVLIVNDERRILIHILEKMACGKCQGISFCCGSQITLTVGW